MKELWQLYCAWFKMGIFTFGGGYAMLPMIQKEAIEKYHWVSEDEIMDYYAVGQCTPGIIAVNTATFVGYKIKGIIGGIVATLGVVSPSLIIISIIARFIINFQELEVVKHALNGIQVAVCVLLAKALIDLYKKSVTDLPTFIICLLAFICVYFFQVASIIIVIGAGIIGYLRFKVKKEKKEGGNL